MHGDKRSDDRQRTRLRSGKLADSRGKFLVECVIYDRSAEGARLRMDGGPAVPDSILLFDDEYESLIVAQVVWRRPHELGVRFMPEVESEEMHRIARRLAGKFYAI
jgi:hypothetical protein